MESKEVEMQNPLNFYTQLRQLLMCLDLVYPDGKPRDKGHRAGVKQLNYSTVPYYVTSELALIVILVCCVIEMVNCMSL